MEIAVELKNLNRTYKNGDTKIVAVDDVSVQIPKGQFVILQGDSGAGKSTVLNILGGMDVPTGGSAIVFGQNIAEYNKKQLTKYRRDNIGFVFQFYNLMPNLTVLENVELARQICKNPLDTKETLEKVGLGERLSNFPSQISGGEQQRVAIARALAKNPDLLLCDEPTGALDYVTGKKILALLYDICKESKMTVIVVTHNSALAAMGDMIIKMKSGNIVKCEENPNPVPVEEIEW